MKMGFASVLIGLTGLVVITYFYSQLEESFVDLGDVQHAVSSYPMSQPMLISLFTLEALGILLGYFAYRRRHVKLGLSGIGLCALCLILLYGYGL